MIEWLGQLLAHVPLWIILPLAIIIGVVWYASPYGLELLIPEKREWWQDKEKRLKRESEKKRLKAKKG